MPLNPDFPWLRAWNGPLTADLVQRPGDFGLGRVPERLQPDATTSMVCGFCATGCGLTVHLREGEAVNLSADPRYPVNLGMACPKGWEALAPVSAPDRATAPLLRNRATGALEPVTWVRAMHEFVGRMKGVQERHGAESVAFLSTGQITTEEMTLLGALFRSGMGGRHCDSNTRQCMATAHVAYKQSIGFDAPPYTYADFEESDCLVFVGSNPCIAHPIMWQRVLRNPHKPAIIVLDPRRTETAMAATLHVPIAPKSDLALLYALANALLARGAVDRTYIDAHTDGFAEFERFVAEFTPERACADAGIPAETFASLVEAVANAKRASFWWTMGVNQGHESTRTAQALINLALMTGSFGRPGTGANSITGQCNAMGSRLFAHATGLPCGREFQNPAHRADVASVLGWPEERIPSTPGWAYDQIIDGIESGAIRGLWIIATNTAHSWIHQTRFRELAKKLEFLVVQDLYADTDTAKLADLILPAAGWGEKDGTLINSERRIGLVKRVRRPPGEALSDFAIFRLVANAWGCGDLFRAWRTPEEVFRLMQRLSAGRPCDFSGIEGYRHLDQSGGIQWPYTAADAAKAGPGPLPVEWRERRLFADGRFHTPTGKARFLFDAPRPPVEMPDADFPLVLLTGRGSSAQWHTNTRTGRSAVLRQMYPADCYVEVNPEDVARLGLLDGRPARLETRRGALEVNVVSTPTVPSGRVFVPMHYDGVNRLTAESFDPHSRQPSYKHCAARLVPRKS